MRRLGSLALAGPTKEPRLIFPKTERIGGGGIPCVL